MGSSFSPSNSIPDRNCLALSTANIEVNCTPEPNPSYIQIQRKSARIGIKTDSDVTLNYLNEANFEVTPFKSKPQDVHWAIIGPCL